MHLGCNPITLSPLSSSGFRIRRVEPGYYLDGRLLQNTRYLQVKLGNNLVWIWRAIQIELRYILFGWNLDQWLDLIETAYFVLIFLCPLPLPLHPTGLFSNGAQLTAYSVPDGLRVEWGRNLFCCSLSSPEDVTPYSYYHLELPTGLASLRSSRNSLT